MIGIVLGIMLIILLSIIISLVCATMYFALDFLKATKNMPSLDSIIPQDLIEKVMDDAKQLEENSEDCTDDEEDEDDSYTYYA